MAMPRKIDGPKYVASYYRINEIKQNTSNDKGITSEQFERKGWKKTLERHEGRHEASKEFKNEAYKHRKKGRCSNAKDMEYNGNLKESLDEQIRETEREIDRNGN